MIADVIGYTGNFIFDTSKPDGTPRKLLDVSRINQLGWHATFSLAERPRMRNTMVQRKLRIKKEYHETLFNYYNSTKHLLSNS